MTMNNEIISSIIGQLNQDKNFPDWWISKEIEIPFFDNEKLIITFMDFDPSQDETFIEEADQALTNYFKLNIEDRKSISTLVQKNCNDFLDAIEFDEDDDHLRQLNDKNEIWKFVYPTEIFVTRRNRRDKDIYVSIDCDCEWEQEHGLQLVFRQGKKLTRISTRDGHLTEADAYDKPDELDELLFAYIKLCR